MLKKESGDKHANWNCHWSAATSIYSIFFLLSIEFLYPFLNGRLKPPSTSCFFLQLFFAHFDKITLFNYSFNWAIINTNRGVKRIDFSIKSRLSIINGQSAMMQNDNFVIWHRNARFCLPSQWKKNQLYGFLWNGEYWIHKIRTTMW